MRASLLVTTKRGAEDHVTRALGRLDGVQTVFPAFGAVDVVVQAEVADTAALKRLSDRAARTPGVERTETLPELEVA